MTEKELDQKIDKAPEQKVRQCLKVITTLWFVERDAAALPASGYGIATFDKPIDGDIIEAVTGELQRFGFCPKEGE